MESMQEGGKEKKKKKLREKDRQKKRTEKEKGGKGSFPDDVRCGMGDDRRRKGRQETKGKKLGLEKEAQRKKVR